MLCFRYDTIPVVMGSPKEDYTKVAPPHSFIHVDDFKTPRHLAEYLHRLSNNDTDYLNYFKWKNLGYISHSSLWCKICDKLHGALKNMWQGDIELWWSGGQDICQKANRSDFKIDVIFNNLHKKFQKQ